MDEYEGFDLEASMADAWTEFGERLSEVLAVMDDTGDLVIGLLHGESRGTGPFVRFSCDSSRVLTAEAASNAELSENHQLGVGSLNLMSAIGWNDPNVAGEHPTSCFWARFDQEDSFAAAQLSVETLRDVYGVQHPAFLAPDQLADVLTPRARPLRQSAERESYAEFGAADIVASMPEGRDGLDALIEAELIRLFGHMPLRDAEGDYSFRFGSTMVFIRSTEDAREVLVFSTVVHDVEGRSRAVEVLNDLNSEARYVRFGLVRDRVFVTMSVLACPFVPAHLHQAIRAVSQVADGVDDDLATKLHGRTTFPSDRGDHEPGRR